MDISSVQSLYSNVNTDTNHNICVKGGDGISWIFSDVFFFYISEKQSETIQSQDRKINELENLVKDLQKQLNDNQADDHTGQKKKRKLDVLETNMNDKEMSNKVNELQVRLAEREAELEETREIL